MTKTIKLLFAILLVAIAVLMYFPIKPEIIYPVESLEKRIGEKQDYCGKRCPELLGVKRAQVV